MIEDVEVQRRELEGQVQAGCREDRAQEGCVCVLS